MRRGHAFLLTAALLALVPAATPLAAEFSTDVPNKVKFAFGGMAANAYTDAGLGSTTAGIGASINFEDIFDLPGDKSVFRFELNWHMNKRQFLDFGYLELNRSGSRILEETVDWGDFEFRAGAQMTASFKSSFPYVAWRYSFLDLPQVRISGSAGLVYLTLEAALSGSGQVFDQNGLPVTGVVNEDVSASVPVPQLGLQLDWNISRRLAVLLYSRQIYVNDIAGATGGIGETAMRMTWWYTKHAGITGGLDKESIDLKRYEDGDTQARFRYEVRGFALYFNFAF